VDEARLEHLTQEELIAKVLELQEEVRMSRVFSANPNASNDAILHWQGRNRFLAEKILPVRLSLDSDKSFQPDKGPHRVIDGDNLAVMTSLLAEFRGGPNRGFDVIYLDPPYNTGGDVFPYNDDFNLSRSEVSELRRKVGRSESVVSLDDPNRHTKWINHMAPRLWAAKKLLKTTGVLIASIDEHELPRLWMLMEEMFGERNRIATLVWERSRKNDANYISEGHEYMLVWARNKTELDAQIAQKGKWRLFKPGLEPHMERFRSLIEEHGEDYGSVATGLAASVKKLKRTSPLWTIRQYVFVDERSRELGPYKEEDPSWPGGGGPDYVIEHPELKKPVRTPPKGWIVKSPEEFQALIDDDRVIWKGLGTPKIKKYLLEGRDKDVYTSVIRKEARQATMMSKAIFGFDNAYAHPKDHQLLADLFNLVTWGNPSAQILDPYGGSGTTGHAVIEMNAADGGSRRCVLIEGGYTPKQSKVKAAEYTDKITAERLRRVISGKWEDGKEHPTYDTGFSFYRARDKISKSAIMASTREHLADIILQIVEDDSNRVDCRVQGHKYLIGKTRLGYGIALVWDAKQPDPSKQALTWKVLDQVLDEAEEADALTPVHIYACSNTAPIEEDQYRFHQIPNAILARLGLLENEADESTEMQEVVAVVEDEELED